MEKDIYLTCRNSMTKMNRLFKVYKETEKSYIVKFNDTDYCIVVPKNKMTTDNEYCHWSIATEDDFKIVKHIQLVSEFKDKVRYCDFSNISNECLEKMIDMLDGDI